MKVGDVVQLRCGGARMVVVETQPAFELGNTLTPGVVVCCWNHESEGHFCTQYPVEALGPAARIDVPAKWTDCIRDLVECIRSGPSGLDWSEKALDTLQRWGL